MERLINKILDRVGIEPSLIIKRLEVANPFREKSKFTYSFPVNLEMVTKIEINPKEKTHRGRYKGAIDFCVPLGTEVLAARSGLVVQVIKGHSKAEGDNGLNLVTVLHEENGILEYSQYCHCSSDLEVGARVELGDMIGKVDMSGESSEPHSHFLVYRNDPKKSFKGLKPQFAEK